MAVLAAGTAEASKEISHFQQIEAGVIIWDITPATFIFTVTKLYFRYNNFYDYILARLTNESLSEIQKQEGFEFTRKLEQHWEQYNDKVFSYYQTLGFKLPEFWFAYSVHGHRNLIPFDDPLTIIIKDDLDEVTVTLVHEICHVFFGYFENKDLGKRLWDYIISIFPKEDLQTQMHLIVIPLSWGGLRQIFSEEKLNQLSRLEKNYEGLEKAWQILDQKKMEPGINPVEYILSLS